MARKPKYRRHAARDRGFVEHGGKRHYLPGPYQSPESMAAYRAFLKRVAAPLVGAKPEQVIIAYLVAAFMRWAEQQYPPGPRSEYANFRAALNHLLASDGMTQAASFGPLRLKALQNKLAAAKKTRTYINACAARVRRMFKWAASEELIQASIYHALTTVPGLRKGRTVAVEPAPRQPVAWEHVAPVLAEVSATVRAMILTQWHTGVRSQSVCQARAGQFDRSAKPWIWKLRHKMEHLEGELVAFVGPKCQKVLRPFLEGRKSMDYLFQPLTRFGKRARGYRSFYDSVSYLRAVSRAIDRVNLQRAEAKLPPIPHWTPHQLRHARATLVRAKYGLEAAQASLGHRGIDATQIYAQAQLERARLVAKEMG